MKRFLILLASVPLTLTLSVGGARAATPVCTGHGAGPVSVLMVTDGHALIQGSATITGCPRSSGVVLVASVQHRDVDGWHDVLSWTDGTTTGQYSGQHLTWTKNVVNGLRGHPNQATVTMTAQAILGDFRVHGSGDGTEWSGPILTCTAGDSGVPCSYGGGD